MSATIARPTTLITPHFYYPDGRPAYEIEKKDGGMRPVTLADARKLNLLPSVTTILKVLDKPALNTWREEQVALSVLTTPRYIGESLDEYVFRCLHTERQQDQEGQKARDRGTEIHAALEKLFKGEEVSPEILPWVKPAFQQLGSYGAARTEVILIGDGYAGKTDLIQMGDCDSLWDFKSTKTLPTSAWIEHRLQCAAYAAAYSKQVRLVATGNVYISTTECGKFTICKHDDWQPAYQAFQHLLSYWQWATGYRPKQ